MNNLIIDIGNTRIKAGVFSGDQLQTVVHFKRDELFKEVDLILKSYCIDNAILSAVGALSDEDIEKIRRFFPVQILNAQTRLPFKNHYGTPETLGVDRIALVAAAVTEFPGEDVLVIDAGSCITYDFVNSAKEYSGGSISPGIHMRYKSLNTFTANLPLLTPPDTIPETGNNTPNAIHRGILNGVVCEIEGIIGQYQQKNQKLTVVLTGGDANFLAKNIKSTIFAIPNFLLVGLNRILLYNLDE